MLRCKYYGQARNQYGMEAWCRLEVEKVWPEVKDVQFMSDRVRDTQVDGNFW